ncbi:family 20 glycosylhydrolase [Butyricicoccus sp.]|uniref:family 20 glycosylhydrolase n=1 Tax=Butyricicoccus sp. TaxID=2049021 RepID=UPI003AAE8E12
MKKIKRALSLVLVFCMLCTMTVTGFAADTTSGGQTDFMKVVHLDAGRKYFSVDSIKKIIDNASADGYNYLELGVGNDGLRFLLDDMSVTANGKTYSSEAVSEAIHAGNEAYYNFNTDELTQSEMDEIISYAKNKGISIIPLINSPGHMDAILSAANSLTGTTCSYNGSKRTIDVTNDTAVAFTQALIQKYVDYFADKGCKYFNMGADEYANDVYTGGSMGFGNLQDTGNYSYFVKYVNQTAAMIKNAGMTPMAFNDGIYFNNNTSSGTFDTDIVISYWSCGWNGYTLMSASKLTDMGFKLINTHGDYYWVLGKSDWQCSAEKASGFNYKEFQHTQLESGTIDNPVGAMFCIWCDYPGADTEANVVSKTADTMAAFAKTLPSTSNSGTTTPNKAPTAPVTKEINLSVGGTTTETVSGNYSDVKTADESIATVKAEYKTGTSDPKLKAVTSIESGHKYLIVNNRTNTVLTSTSSNAWNNDNNYGLKLDGTASTDNTADLWTVTTNGSGYTVQNTSNAYLTIGENTASVNQNSATLSLSYNNSDYWTISQNGCYLNNLGESVQAGGYKEKNGNGASTDAGSKWTLYEIVSEASGQTTLTFTGVAVGTTTVQVGDATYTVNVVGDAPSNAPAANTIYLEYWITNSQVYNQENTNSAYYKAITTSTNGVKTETGVDVSTLAPEHAYSNFDGWKDVYYWQTMRLDADNKQTGESGDDETADGTTLTHIRYWNNAWQYQTSDSTWHYFQSGDQLVAYYLQKTDVTKEITTYAKDWGYSTNTVDGTTDSGTPNTSSGKGQVALTVAVVYPDGTVSPAESGMYSKSTTIFNYWDNRDIGIVAPINNSDYDISKITVTDGKRDKNTGQNVWYSSDSITWNKTTNDAGSKWYDEKTVWDETTNAGTTPMVNGKTSNITWSAKNTAKLVLIYLKPVQKETNLNVVYWDDSINAQINKNDIQVAMKYNQGDPQPSFVTSLIQESPVNVGEFTLDDDAYVTNSSGINQTFNKDITLLPNVDTKYQTGLYEYQKADISQDGKILTLHYAVDNSKVQAKYVVDFGKPVNVPIRDILTGDAAQKTIDKMTFKAEYGDATVTHEVDNSITFTPTSIMKMPVIVTAKITFKDGSQVSPKIAFIPASNVMYEESFVKLGDTSDWTKTGTAGTSKQAKEVLGKEGIHGYDASYDNDSQFSNGSAYRAQLTLARGKDFVKTQDKATFTFTGTGFDLISECGKNTGIVSVVVKNTDGKTVKSYMVDTYFTGDEHKIISGTGILDYQVPIVRCTGLKQGTYTVETRGYLTDGSGVVAKTAEETTENNEVSKETVAEVLDDLNIKNVEASQVEATCMDDNSVLLGGTGVEETAAKSRSARAAAATTSANVYIDGVRVYNTLNENNGANKYTKSEQNVKYESVYDYVKNSLDSDGNSTAVYVEYDGNQDAWNIADYKQQGPENEVYLAPGNSIAIALDGYKKGNTVQIAAKAINGEVSCDGLKTRALSTATEMYYTAEVKDDDGSAYVQITNNAGGVLALSEMKVSSGVSAIADPELATTVLDKLNHKADFVPETLTVSAPETLAQDHLSTLSVKASASDVDKVYYYIDGDEDNKTELKPNNSKAVKRGKSKTYSYSVAINQDYDLAVGEHTYSVYAVSKDGKRSDPVVAKVQVTGED